MANPKKFLSGVDLASQKITNVADGSTSSDAATYGQLLNMINGLTFHPACRVASTTNLTTTAPGTTIDGVTMVTGDRVLLKDQTTASENGIWVFATSSTAMTRAADGTTGNLLTGATVVVDAGTANIDTQWTLNTQGTITVGTTAQTWARSGGGGSTYTAGNGIAIASSVISAVAGTGISVGGGGIAIDTTVVVRKFATNVGTGSSTSITVTHNLGTLDVTVGLYDNTSFDEVEAQVTHATTNTITLGFSTAPGSNALRCVVHG